MVVIEDFVDGYENALEEVLGEALEESTGVGTHHFRIGLV